MTKRIQVSKYSKLRCGEPWWKTGSNSEIIILGHCKKKRGHKGLCWAVVDGEEFTWDRKKVERIDA